MLAADVEAAGRARAGRRRQAAARLRPLRRRSAPRADAVLASEHRERVYRPQGWFSPVLLADGRIEGVWRHERNGDELTLFIESFTRVPRHVKAGVEAEAERLAGFLGGDWR